VIFTPAVVLNALSTAAAMRFNRHDGETETTLRIEGALDAATVSGIRPVLEAIVADPSKRGVVVVIDALEMIDSSGVGVLVSLAKQLRAESRTLRVEGAQGQPLMVLKLLKLEALFTMTDASSS